MNKIFKLFLVSIWLMSTTFMYGYGLPSFSGGGAGTQADPFKISVLNDLKILSGNSTYWGSGKYYIQTADIDASSTSTWNDNGAGGYYGFFPIGNANLYFYGNYDGKGYSITGLYINRPTASYVGFFGYTSSSATISNLKLVSCNIVGKDYVGALIGSSSGSISNSSSSGSVSGVNKIGGFMGEGGNCTNCNSSCAVNGSVDVGGFLGLSFTGSFTNCFSAGTVTATGSVGGFVGTTNNSDFIKCFSASNVSGNVRVGGFIGRGVDPFTFTNCYAKGIVAGEILVGGFAGYVDISTGRITNCYCSSVVNGTTNVSGFIGLSSNGTSTECYFDADVDGLAATTAGTSYNGGAGKTTAEMKAQATFTGWDFPTTWKINANNNGYPYLAWQIFPAPEIDVKQGSTAIVDGTDTYDFGSKITATNTNIVFTIENTGTAASTLGSFTIGGTNADQFSLQGTNPTTVANAGSTTFTIRFTPTSTGSKTATVSFDNQDSDENPFTFTITGTGEQAFSGRAGTQADPYKIATLADLQFLSENSTYWATDKYFIQTADIDASSTSTLNSNGAGGYYGFSPIGNATTQFRGNYNGQGYTITGLYINRPATDNIGLFGYANSTAGSKIENLGIINANITGKQYVSALAGQANNFTINNTYSNGTGTVTGNSNYVGGLVGSAGGSNINNSYSTKAVTGNSYVGGLVGYLYTSNINYSYSTGAVTATIEKVGGLVGYFSTGNINKSYSTGNVTGTTNAGGLVGYTYGTTSAKGYIFNSYSKGNVIRSSGVFTNLGGFIGFAGSYSYISTSYSTGSVTFPAASPIIQNYKVGEALKATDPMRISSPPIQTNKGFVGGLSGTDVTFYYCFWDTQSSGASATAGSATGKNTADMKTQATFTDTNNWDFATTPVWKIDATINSGYPYLVFSEINVKQGVTSIDNNTGSYNFGSKNISSNTDIVFTIENIGTAASTLSNFSITGTNADQFSLQGINPTTVANASSTTFTIRFTPTSTGSKTATISFANQDDNENSYSFTITGTGVASEIDLKQGATAIADGTGTYYFGSQTTSSNTDIIFTIANTGTAASTLGSFSITGADADQFSLQGTIPTSVASAGSTTFTIRFTPTSLGSKTASVSFANDDVNENPYNFTITGNAGVPMQLKFTTTAANQFIRLPLFGTVNCTVNWGDGTSNENVNASGILYHSFAIAGAYTVSINGSLTQFGNGANGWAGAGYLTEVSTFGELGLTSLSGAFNAANNLISVPAALPTTVTDLSNCFYTNAKASITNLDLWDVSHVTNMTNMFRAASAFNQNISNWNVSSVTDMSYMFYSARAFNQNIGSWTVSKVTNMNYMFGAATVFDQPIGGWNVSSVTNMSSMFNGASAFNQNIGSWIVSNVTNLSYMFFNAPKFNQNIGSWTVSKVTNLSGMFSGATAFNQNIGSWNIAVVTNMTDMFKNITLSTANYDALLIGWAAQTVKPNVVFSGGNSKYTAGAAATARGTLTGSTNTWTITDGGQDIGTSVENTNNMFSLQISPNPVRNQFSINGFSGNAEITIVDMTGKVCQKAQVSSASVVSVSHLPKGIYVVQVNNENKTVRMKMIKD